MVKLLLDHGADVLAETVTGETALQGGVLCSGSQRDRGVVEQNHAAVLAMLRAEENEMAKFVAFAMGLNERLGAGSRVRWLTESGLLKMVLRPDV